MGAQTGGRFAAPEPFSPLLYIRVRDAAYAVVVSSMVGGVVAAVLLVDHYGGFENYVQASPETWPLTPFVWSMAATTFVQLMWVSMLTLSRPILLGRDLGFRISPVDIPIAILGYGIVIGGYQLIVAFVLPALGDLDLDGQQSQLPSAFGRATETDLLVLTLLIGVAVPFAEELLFRGIIFRSIEVRIGAGMALVLSSLVFGVAHVQTFTDSDVPIVAFALWAGLVLGSMTWLTQRLAPAIITHVLNNSIVMLVWTS